MSHACDLLEDEGRGAEPSHPSGLPRGPWPGTREMSGTGWHDHNSARAPPDPDVVPSRRPRPDPHPGPTSGTGPGPGRGPGPARDRTTLRPTAVARTRRIAKNCLQTCVCSRTVSRVDNSSITPTPQQLRALTHPVRLRMLGILRTEGPTTATALAPAARPQHRRDVVPPAPAGPARLHRRRRVARQRPGPLVAGGARVHSDQPGGYPDPADKEALDAYLQTVVVLYTQMLQQASRSARRFPTCGVTPRRSPTGAAGSTRSRQSG